MQSQFGILAMIQQGYYATYPLLFISVVCMAIIFERLWSLRGIGPQAAKIADALVAPLRQGRFNEAMQQVQGQRNAGERVYYALISGAQALGRDKLMELEEERRFREMLELKRYTWVLATSGASAPFIGLFGTVVGILVAFQSMAIMGTGGF
jgi:biopolymer transport protein ExbB